MRRTSTAKRPKTARKQRPHDDQLENVALAVDRRASAFLDRLGRYIARRWPRLAAWLADDGHA